MNGNPYSTYHPPHGRQGAVVHNNDVLCGRGVNIAQHPGNERFRALVSTINDDSYCTSYTTNEKRALAEDVIKHIRSLDPPGRFLKRGGRSQSSRGLSGPWEELSPKECIKKTCQALRDCNRMDRQGYAAQVPVPTDVQASANQRSASGLSLKEQAAAAVAKARVTNENSDHLGLNPPAVLSPEAMSVSASILSKRSRADFSPNPDSLASGSPTMDMASASAHKQPRSDDSSPLGGEFTYAFTPVQAPTPAVSAQSMAHTTSSSAPSLAATPASSTDSTPATETRQPYHLVHHYHNQNFSSIAVPQLNSHSHAPIESPESEFQQDPRALSIASTAPCSPVAIFPAIPEVSSSETGMDDHSPLDMGFGMSFHRPVFYQPQEHHGHHFYSHPDLPHLNHHDISQAHHLDHHQHDVTQNAADAAVSLENETSIPVMGFSLMSSEEVQHHGSLGIDDL
jgi:hypothetical protein